MLTIRDVMVRTVVTVEAHATIKEVAQALVDNRISGMPVVDADGVVLGVVSEADVLLKEGGADAIQHRSLARVRGESQETRAQLAKAAATTAGEAMTAPPITIGPDRSIADAAALMTGRRVNRLPVVEDGRLVGIVSRADLVRAFIRSDDELARTIREDVLLRVLWLDPTLFSVEVVDGIATVDGRVERRSTTEMIERCISLVPGIVGGRVTVSWSLDDTRREPTGGVDAGLPDARD
jgi:CBS domain-containing protein